jgi:hypothetical protein
MNINEIIKSNNNFFEVFVGYDKYIIKNKLTNYQAIELLFDIVNYGLNKKYEYDNEFHYYIENFLNLLAKISKDKKKYYTDKFLETLQKLNEIQFIKIEDLESIMETDVELYNKVLTLYVSKKENIKHMFLEAILKYNQLLSLPNYYINIDVFYEYIDIIPYRILITFLPEKFEEIMKDLPENLMDKLIEKIMIINDIKLLQKLNDNYEMTFNENNLEFACLKERSDFIKYFLEHKISPTKNCLKYLYKNCDELSDNIELMNKFLPLFLDYGYQLTEEDIINLCKIQIQINNFENYKFSHNAFIICCEKNFFPEYAKFKPTIGEFTEFINSTPNLTVFNRYVSKSKIKLDVTYLEIICSNFRNYRIINHLLKKMESNIKCIENFLISINKFINNIDFFEPESRYYNIYDGIRFGIINDYMKSIIRDEIVEMCTGSYKGRDKELHKFKVEDVIINLIEKLKK